MRISLDEWNALEPMLDAALDVDDTERDAYLQSVCRDDPARGARLGALLEACERGRHLLTRPAESFAPLLRVPEMLGGRYRILRELGHGGMATVYLADDAKHNRQVAVKVLDIGVVETMGSARFLQEIEIAARLHHPHIIPLFDSGETNGLLYFVMPVVEGESLRDRLLRQKMLPLDEALRIATEVAHALDFAHRHGVVHRDIKPDNILLHDGQSLVADFGIALAMREAVGDRTAELGRVIGTPHYMSPEQASADQEVTSQSDIYSLGVVLYEMLAGQPPHTGHSPQEILHKVREEPVPALAARRKSVPPNVAAAVARATEPLPVDRFRTAHDFAAALADPGFRHGGLPGAPVVSTPWAWNRLTTGFAALAIGGAALASYVGLRTPPTAPLARVDVTPGAGRAMLPMLPGVEFALSRDGSQLVYVGENPSGATQLWRRTLDALDATPIPGSDGALAPSISPDGRFVAFVVRREIRTLPLHGGRAITIVHNGGTPAWGGDGFVYFPRLEPVDGTPASGDGARQRLGSVTYRVPAAGGEPLRITQPLDGEQDFIDVLPDGAGLLMTIRRLPPADSRIAVVGPKGGEPREILAGTMARFAAPGQIVYATIGGALMVAPFDPRRLEVRGPSLPFLEGVKVKLGSASQFALSQAGPLVYQKNASDANELVWVSRTGRVEPLDSQWRGTFAYPALSPDGSRLAVSVSGPQAANSPRAMDVWIRQLATATNTRLTVEGGAHESPTWTRDGASVTYAWERTGGNAPRTLWTKRLAGAATRAALVPVDSGANPRWSPDGEWLVYRVGYAGDIFGLRPGKDTVPLPLVASGAAERSPVVSPDGRWLAYTSNALGRDEIYVRPFPNTDDGAWVVSTSGGREPLWSRSGRELFYRNGQHMMVAVSVRTKPTFATGAVTTLFSAQEMVSSQYAAQYDVTRDDQRFVMIRRRGTDAAESLVLITDWRADVQRIASAR